MRAISGNPDLEVSFSSDKPSLVGEKARLPEPTRRMLAKDVAVTRGLGDSMALKLAEHDTGVHAKFAPNGQEARAVFDAVEGARCDALGAQAMDGVADNISAMLEDRYFRGNYHEITDKADAPLADALALLVREKLTGARPPESAERLVDLWRPWLEDKCGDNLSCLSEQMADQKGFAGAVRDILAQLDMAEELGEEAGEDADDTEGETDADAPDEAEAEVAEDDSGEESSP
ncbi:MAG: cobaltochelatase subunit CobT, partial [Pseudomonadota bacterium]